MSGAVGLTDEEKGTRGLWLEKRRALLKELRGRGHEVSVVNRMTAPSKVDDPPRWDPKRCDLLMIEFGSSNARFYGEDLALTQCMADEHAGPIVFLCDDPDLPYAWKMVTSRRDRWTAWFNASMGVPFGGQPPEIRILDAPFASL